MRSLFATRSSAGFTVIEVLIVLAITGLLFAATAALLAGKQNQTAFDQAIRQVQAQIQQGINDVAVGYFPNVGNVKCTAGGSGPDIVALSGSQQGANTGCVFLGKAMQFGVSADPEMVVTHTIAALQKDPVTGGDVTSLLVALPKGVAPSSVDPNIPDADTSEPLQQGLTTYRMWYNSGAGDRKIGEVAFTNSLASYSGGSIISGSQQVVVVPVDDGGIKSVIGAGKTATDGIDAINSSLKLSPTNPTSGVFICLVSAGTTQSGLITIGNNGRQLSVKLDIKSDKTCNNLGV